MPRREFQFEEGTSRKFWAITVDGSTHIIQFGRIGSSGQTQSKGFPSPEAAQAAADKLIGEKARKGYREVSGAETPAGESAPAEPAPAAAKSKAKKGPAVEITRSIDLDLSGCRGPVWDQPLGDRAPKPRAAPFDFAKAVKKLHKGNNENPNWFVWFEVYVPDATTPEEARFWFRVYSALPDSGQAQRKAFIDSLREEDLAQQPTTDELIQGFSRHKEGFDSSRAMFAQSSWLPPGDMMLLAHSHPWVTETWYSLLGIYRWLRNVYLPHLSDADRERARGWVRNNLTKLPWPRSQLAAYGALTLDLHECLGPFVEGLPDGFLEGLRTWGSHPILFSLATPEEVERQVRRLKLGIATPEHGKAWLAWTEYRGLDLIAQAAIREGKGYYAEGFTDLLCAVRAPEVTPYLLEVKLSITTPRLAKKAQAALDAQPGNAIAGLLPLVTQKGKLAEAALQFLLDARARGLGDFIDEQVKSAAPEVVARLSKSASPAPAAAATLDEGSLPKWLSEALAAPVGKRQFPDWVLLDTLPAILVEGRSLPAPKVETILRALMGSTLEAPAPLVKSLREHGDRPSLHDFSWALFERWLDATAPSKDKWAFLALGHLGGKSAVVKLTPKIRAWPGESQHQRAVTGLEVLRTIGTDSALMALNGMAQKLKFKGLQERAVQMMSSIASSRGLSREQLEDRIVPDLGLDARGGRTFDYGPRRFTLALSGEMDFMVRDDSGKLLKDPPKPGAKDDPAKASAALEEWKLLKKQLREVAKVQGERLQQAMIVGRRWPVEDFEAFLVKHPLMTLFAQRLLWAGYDGDGDLPRLFRVNGEQACVDENNQPCSLEGVVSVGLPHPLHLDDRQKQAWRVAFADYEILPPFPQLNRELHALTPQEAQGNGFARPQGRMPAASARGILEGNGWLRDAHDHGGIEGYHKPFSAANLTAFVTIDPPILLGYSENEDVRVERVYFLAGINPYPGAREYVNKGGQVVAVDPGLPLADIDPVVTSEVLLVLTQLGEKVRK